MTEIITFIQGVQLGTISGWTLVALLLLFWWKGLPTLIEVWEKRSTGIEARLNAAMLAYTERMDKQLEEADKQHRLCTEEQDKLRDRVTTQDKTIAQQNDTIAKQSMTIMGLTDQINALKTSNVQQQIIEAEGIGTSAALERAIVQLKEVK